MVGVPSSRGCVACRKQKKRCHAENNVPPCLRCRRLQIDCIGLGERRLKFQDESEKLASAFGARDASRTPSQPSTALVTRASASVQIGYTDPLPNIWPSTPPTSELTRLTAAYVRGVDPHADISVHLPWNFGPFLEDVPQRLGANEALDAAADALLASYACLRSRQHISTSRPTLQKYSKALHALAATLSKPAASSTETLCAVNMLMIFETLAGSSAKGVISHAGGAARIFKARGFAGGAKSELEAKLQLSIRAPVVIGSLFNMHSYFTPAEWAHLTQSEIGATTAEEQSFRCLALYARLLQRARRRLYGGRRESEQSLEENLWDVKLVEVEVEAAALREKHDPMLRSLRGQFWDLDKAVRALSSATEHHQEAAQNAVSVLSNEGPDAVWRLKVWHAHIGRSYGMAIATQILLNALLLGLMSRRAQNSGLGASDGLDTVARDPLEVENGLLALETCRLAEAVECHRPLGTVYLNFVIRVAYIGAGLPGLDGMDGGPSNASGNISNSGDTGDTGDAGDTGNSAVLDRTEPLKDSPLPLVPGTRTEQRIRALLRLYSSDFEWPRVEDELAAEIRAKAELEWMRELFTLRVQSGLTGNRE